MRSKVTTPNEENQKQTPAREMLIRIYDQLLTAPSSNSSFPAHSFFSYRLQQFSFVLGAQDQSQIGLHGGSNFEQGSFISFYYFSDFSFCSFNDEVGNPAPPRFAH